MSEEISFSDYLYERRYNAQSKIDDAKIVRRKARVACAIGAVVLFAVMVAFILGAYDNEQVVLFFALVALYLVLTATVFYCYGAIKIGSFSKFFNSVRLISRWEDMIEYMDKIEAKYAEKTLHPSDLEKMEKRLIKLCDEIDKKM